MPARSRRFARSIAALALGLFAVLMPVPAQAASHAVDIMTYAYMPASLSVQVGDTVTWTNHDSVGHDVTVTNGPVSFKSPLLAQGQSWSYTFSTAGAYSYICSVHPDMKATVSVAAAPAAAAPAAPGMVAAAAPPHHPSAMASMPMPAAAAAAAPAAAPAASAAAPSATTVTETVAPAASAAPTETFDPLLLVGGAVLAVLVFCLLLIATRPDASPSPESAAPDVEAEELPPVARIG